MTTGWIVFWIVAVLVSILFGYMMRDCEYHEISHVCGCDKDSNSSGDSMVDGIIKAISDHCIYSFDDCKNAFYATDSFDALISLVNLSARRGRSLLEAADIWANAKKEKKHDCD